MVSETLIQCCPSEVTEALTGILRESILLIRMAANGGDADFCVMEANHIHNLPSLLRCYDREKLVRYLSWAQSGYAADFESHFHRPPTMFIPHWQHLKSFLRSTEIEAT